MTGELRQIEDDGLDMKGRKDGTMKLKRGDETRRDILKETLGMMFVC